MNGEPKNIDVLQNLESIVVHTWDEQREMTDYAVARVYEAVFEHYRDEARGHQPKPCRLSGPDRELFERIHEMCEIRLGRGDSPWEEPITPIPVPEMVDCLRVLRKSVDRHTRHGGRQGYLEFISKYVA